MRNLCLLFSLLFCLNTNAQLVEGTVMFVGFNADGKDGFSVVPLINIPSNTTIYFSDNEWNGSLIILGGAFLNTTEGEITWLTGASEILAGTVITFDGTSDDTDPSYGVTIGTISGEINLNASDEVLYAYLGSDDVTPTRFLSAITNSGFTLSNGTLLGTGLINLVSAISIPGDPDIMIYKGSGVCNSTVSACAALIGLPINWITDDGSGDQSNDGNSPDFPADVPPSFSGSALPIELHSFEVTKMIDENILIEWVTLSEINNDYFTVEKSSNLLEWSSIGNLNGAGSSSNRNGYSYVDYFPFAGVNYYRLKQTDYDGRTTYSDAEVIMNDVPELDLVYPNPTKGVLFVVSDKEIRLFSSIGVDVTDEVLIQSNNQEHKIDMSSLSNGVFLLRMGDNYKRIIKK